MPQIESGKDLPTKPGSRFAEIPPMLFLILTAIVLCTLAGWIVLHLGVEVVQALVAVAMMTITWHLLRRRPNMTIADQFRNW
jgi:Flp pilus assembly protein TadB